MLNKSRVLIAVACFLPGRAKDLLALRRAATKVHRCFFLGNNLMHAAIAMRRHCGEK